MSIENEKGAREVKYLIAHGAIARLLQQNRITTEQGRRANVAYAEKCGVLPLEICAGS